MHEVRIEAILFGSLRPLIAVALALKVCKRISTHTALISPDWPLIIKWRWQSDDLLMSNPVSREVHEAIL